MESVIGRIGGRVRAALRRAGRWVLRVRIARAAREAERVREATGLRMMVFRLNGKIRVAPKRTVKGLVRSGRFRRGVTVRDIERNCLYITWTRSQSRHPVNLWSVKINGMEGSRHNETESIGLYRGSYSRVGNP